MNLFYQLLPWYDSVKRNLPWRQNSFFYPVWISEIMLQQTRVNQMLIHYDRFMKSFPTLESLALADETLVLKTWEGLGYYSRARNIHFTAKHIYYTLNNKPPTTYKDLLTLKGIGTYTAAAIASIVYNEAVAAVDGNVFRVFSRYFGIYDDISISSSKKIFESIGNEFILKDNPGDCNQAVMELGASLCSPTKPDCLSCPIHTNCYAFQHGKTEELPVKSKKIKQRNRFFNYLIINNTVYVKQRTTKDIWLNLYDLPMIESKEKLQTIVLYNNINVLQSRKIYQGEHKLTHQTLFIDFWDIIIDDYHAEILKMDSSYIAIHDASTLALPKPITEFIQKFYPQLK